MTSESVVIQAESGRAPIAALFSELIAHRELFWFFVWRDIKVLYAQSVLGIGWAIVRPLVAMIIFTVIFGQLAKIPSDGLPYPLFAYSALLPWFYFATALTKSADSLVVNSKVWSKVYFPRVLVPLAPVATGLVDLLIASLILGLLMIYYGVTPGLHILFLPIVLFLLMLTAIGSGLWLSALAVQFRDVKHANQFVTQLLMYAAPVVWPASLLLERFPEYGEWIRIAFGFYPMAGAIEGFRSAILGASLMPWDLIGYGYVTAVLLCWSGARYFASRERAFADVV